MAVTAEDIEVALRQRFAPAFLEVQDDSSKHAGHAGAREGRHFTVRVVCDAFAGQSRVQRHRLVYDALASLIVRGIHALVIEARAPEEPPVFRIRS